MSQVRAPIDDQPPFEIVECSWPRPVEASDGYWTSDVEWDAPAMPTLPEPGWTAINGDRCWAIDWRQFFGGEMRGFHVVFRVNVKSDGRLVFWADDGCVIRREGQVIHSDRAGHIAARSEIDVRAGDRLEVAQWQYWGGWLWGAWIDDERPSVASALDELTPYLPNVRERLASPNGPVLKMHTHGAAPIRALVGLYSMILNGYAPDGVQIFGAHQWDQRARDLFAELAPFADIVPVERFLENLQTVGGPRLAEMAHRHWFVMKAFATLLHPPYTSCLMDDDVFVLDRVDDALDALQSCDLVFAPDVDWGSSYRDVWPWLDPGPSPLVTGTFNAALYWIRSVMDPGAIARHALRCEPAAVDYAFHWEQGLIAMLYAQRNTRRLPSQRYLYPAFDGLPAGTLGYDYASNPCGFASIHFGAHFPKPSDAEALQLAPRLLARHRTVNLPARSKKARQTSWSAMLVRGIASAIAAGGVSVLPVARDRFRHRIDS